MPVSRTSNAQRALGRRRASRLDARPTTSPRSVNLTALPTRLIRTWRSRAGVAAQRASARRRRRRRPARGPCRGRAARAARRRPRRRRAGRSRRVSSSSLPASIFEKSRMSLMIVSSASPRRADRLGVARAARRRASVSSSSSVMPMTPFIGVRISWLMLARNSDFRRADSSAASRAVRQLRLAAACAR